MAINRSLMDRQLYQQGGEAIYPRMYGLSSDISEAEQMLQQINQSIDQVQSNLGKDGGAVQLPFGQQPQTMQPLFDKDGFRSGDQRYGTGLVGGPQMALNNSIPSGISGQNSGQPFNPGGDINSILGDYRNSDFFHKISTADVRPFTFGGEEMSGSSTYIGGLKNYLDSIGKSDLFGGYNQKPLTQTLGSSPMSMAMRNMAANGGIMPRQMYGLGSLVKSITKGVKKIVKSPLGKAALLAGGAYFAPTFFGNFGNLIKGGITQALPAAKSFLGGEKTFGKTAAMFAAGSLLPLVLGDAEQSGDLGVTRNVDALRTKLTNAYKNQRTFSDAADEDSAVAAQVQSDLSEYTSGAGGYANGGRIGYAYGDVVDQASGIMGLPKRVNQVGVKELDLRDSGGFIPPVGVKEKADDIPAMLSNNEFVFTAKSVKEMGDGDVNRGAQRMYDMMKYLEKGGRV